MVISLQRDSHYLTCHKKSRLLFVLSTSVRQAVTVHSPVCVVRTSHVVSYSCQADSNQLWYVQWLVASFLTWHSLHGKPTIILSSNLTLHSYHVTAFIVYRIQVNISSLFFQILYFFIYNILFAKNFVPAVKPVFAISSAHFYSKCTIFSEYFLKKLIKSSIFIQEIIDFSSL